MPHYLYRDQEQLLKVSGDVVSMRASLSYVFYACDLRQSCLSLMDTPGDPNLCAHTTHATFRHLPRFVNAAFRLGTRHFPAKEFAISVSTINIQHTSL